MYRRSNTHIDLSDSVREDLKDDENTKVVGKFKDETNSLPKTESVALNPKCYSFKHLKKDVTINNKKNSKMCFFSNDLVKDQITHDNIMDSMKMNEQLSRDAVSLRSKDHVFKNYQESANCSKHILRQDETDKCKRLSAIGL